MYDALAADAVNVAVYSIGFFMLFTWGVLILYVGLRGWERTAHRRRRRPPRRPPRRF